MSICTLTSSSSSMISSTDHAGCEGSVSSFSRARGCQEFTANIAGTVISVSSAITTRYML